MCAAPIRGGAATYLSALEQHVAPRGHVGCQVRVKPLLAFLQRAAIDRVSDLPGRTTVEEKASQMATPRPARHALLRRALAHRPARQPYPGQHAVSAWSVEWHSAQHSAGQPLLRRHRGRIARAGSADGP